MAGCVFDRGWLCVGSSRAGTRCVSWLADCVAASLTDRVTLPLTDCVTASLTDCVTVSLTDCVTVSLTDCATVPLTDRVERGWHCHIGWLTD